MRYKVLLFLGLLISINIQAQFIDEGKTKKELRKERREKRRLEAELKVKEAYAALQEKDFTLRADVIFNRRNEVFQVLNTTNFVVIDGDKIFVQYGDPINIGLNGSGGATLEGNITKFELSKLREGKPIDARIFFFSPNTGRSLSVFIQLTGEIVEARVLNGSRRMKMRGKFERTSKSAIVISRNYRNGM